MSTIHFDKIYYHGLDCDNFRREIPNYELSLCTLATILKTRAIYSREKLLEYKIIKDKSSFRDTINWNGNEYVSISKNCFSSSPFESYDVYVKPGMAIMISDQIEEELEFRKEGYNRLMGEFQVKEKIPSDYFLGITISIPDNSINLFEKDLKQVETILVKTGLTLPIYIVNDDDIKIMNRSL